MLCRALAVSAAFVLGGAAQAAVTQVNSQSDFSALGVINQNSNFDAFPENSLSNPYTIGGITFNSGGNYVIGAGSFSGNTRNLLIFDFFTPLPGSISGSYNLFGFSLGVVGQPSAINVDLETSAGSYHFLVTDTSTTTTSFIGFAATAGETFQSFTLSSVEGGGSGPGVTDLQLGTALALALAPVPEAEIWAMLLAGLGLSGFVAGRRSRQRGLAAC